MDISMDIYIHGKPGSVAGVLSPEFSNMEPSF